MLALLIPLRPRGRRDAEQISRRDAEPGDAAQGRLQPRSVDFRARARFSRALRCAGHLVAASQGRVAQSHHRRAQAVRRGRRQGRCRPRPGHDPRQRTRGRRHHGARPPRPGDRRRRHPGDHAVFLESIAGSDRGLFRPAVHVDRSAGAVLQFAELSRRRGNHRRLDGAAHRETAEFRRRQGSELQQRKVSGNFPRRAKAAAEFFHADRGRVSAAVGATRRHRLVFGGRLDLPEFVQRPVRQLRRRRMDPGPRTAIQDDAAVAPVQGSVPLLAQGRHGDHGPPGRPDPRAIADRDAGASSLYPRPARGSRHSRHRATRLVSGGPQRLERTRKKMSFEPGLVHTPLTPFAADGRIDFERYGTLLDFHLRNGADALAVPMHAGESVSLPDEEKRALIRFVVARADSRAPVIAHVSDAGTGIAAALARFAQEAGAAAIVTTTPYYWTPPPAMAVEHFAQIGAAVTIPLFVFNAPGEMAGSKINAAGALKLVERLPNFAGLVDDSLDWQFMIELLTDV